MPVVAVSGAEFRKFAADLRAAAQNVEGDVGELLTKVGKAAESTAKARARVDSGAMRDSIVSRRESATAVVVEATERYAYFHEFGTSSMAPQPMIGPAFEEGQKRLVDGFEDIIDGLLS